MCKTLKKLFVLSVNLGTHPVTDGKIEPLAAISDPLRSLNLLTRKLTLNILANVSGAVRRWCNAGGQVMQLCNICQRLNNANSEAESGRLSMLARVFECDIHRRRY